MKTRTRAAAAAFSLIELIIYAALGTVVSFIAYGALRSAAVLSVKNTNLNRSHDDLRSAYDRMARNLLSANNVPTLVNTSGVVQAVGPAAGFSFDRNLGGPYVLDPPTAAGALASTASTATFWASTASLSTAPLPKAGEIMLIPTPSGTIRASVSAVGNLFTDNTNKLRRFTATFTAPVGQALSWGANQPQSAKLVRPEAFIVVGGELRNYPTFQPLPVLGNPANYKLLTDQISTDAGEQTPFTISDFNGDRVLTSTLRVRERRDGRWIKDEEANAYNTYFQLQVNLPSRVRPATSN